MVVEVKAMAAVATATAVASSKAAAVVPGKQSRHRSARRALFLLDPIRLHVDTLNLIRTTETVRCDYRSPKPR